MLDLYISEGHRPHLPGRPFAWLPGDWRWIPLSLDCSVGYRKAGLCNFGYYVINCTANNLPTAFTIPQESRRLT
jgi:hypothetical protein